MGEPQEEWEESFIPCRCGGNHCLESNCSCFQKKTLCSALCTCQCCGNKRENMEMILEKSRELLYKETDQEKETDDPSKTPEEIRKSKKEEQEKLNKKEEKIKKEKKPRKSEEKLVTKAKIEDALQNLKSGFEKIKLDDLQLLLIRDVQKVKTRPLKEGEEYAKVMAETQCECVLKKARICMSLLLRGKKK